MKTIVILPVYNEAKYIAQIIKEAKPYVDEVIAVDDGSRDDSFEQAKQAGATAVRHSINLGKACALKTGCEAALKCKADIIIFMDSDGQHLPKDLPRFIEPLKNNQADLVIGSRVGGDKMPFVRKYGNLLLQIVVRLLFNVNVRDIQSGYRAFTVKAFPRLKWNSKNYHADAEITARAGRYHLRCHEILIQTIYHDPYKGMTIIDGLSLINKLFIWKFTL